MKLRELLVNGLAELLDQRSTSPSERAADQPGNTQEPTPRPDLEPVVQAIDESLRKVQMWVEVFAEVATTLITPCVRALEEIAVQLEPAFIALRDAAVRWEPTLVALVELHRAGGVEFLEREVFPQWLCARLADDVCTNNVTTDDLRWFTVEQLGLRTTDVPHVAEAFWDKWRLQHRSAGNSWGDLADPFSYLKAAVRHRRAKAQRLDLVIDRAPKRLSLDSCPEVVLVLPEGEPLPSVAVAEGMDALGVIERELRARGARLDTDSLLVVRRRLEGNLHRTLAGAASLGWDLQKLERIWRHVDRELKRLGIDVNALRN